MTGQSGTLSPTIEPASNLKGSAAGAAWTYLLDSLELEHVVCVGRPSAAALSTLRRIGTRVTIVDANEPGQIADEPTDLAYIAAAGRSDLLMRVARTLSPAGRLYVEGRGKKQARELVRLMDEAGLSERRMFWLTPDRGEARSATPVDDVEMREYFTRHAITVASWHRVLRPLERLAPIAATRTRFGLIAGRPGAAAGPQVGVPGYLHAMAASAGANLSGYRVGLSARGRYSSRKVIFYLFAPDARRPRIIVKATRDPAHNERLVNEERALRSATELRLVAPGTAPEVLFAGDHGGLRFMAQSAVEGELLTSHAHRIGGAAAYAWLIDLAAASARRDPEASHIVVSTVERIDTEIRRVHALAEEDSERLRHAVEVLVQGADTLPVVFTHGDAATWNARLLVDGRIAFMDWEAAQAQGMPLWDIFYFARSHVIWGSRIRELARRPRQMTRALLGDAALRDAVDLYRRRLEIAPGLVGPLFSMCWAHRALKEVSRLEANSLPDSHYLALLHESLKPGAQAAWSVARA